MAGLRISIATPCTESWNAMSGTDRVRACLACKSNVYNIEAMTELEVRKLLKDTTGRVCLRLYRRSDGTVMTKDCPVALAKARRAMVKFSAFAVASVLALCGVMRLTPAGQQQVPTLGERALSIENELRNTRFIGTVINTIDPQPAPPPLPPRVKRSYVMGGKG